MEEIREKEEENAPLLKLISTPIGNLKDLSPRARDVLEREEIFLAEDTRVLRKLMDLCGISQKGKRIESFNDHDQEKIDFYREKFEGRDICLVSDAGSPLLSDPAFPFVKAWLQGGGRVESLPGPSAVVTALEVSGFPPQPFTFYGFLPRKKGAILSSFEQLPPNVTHIYFESPQRMEKTLNLLEENFPDYEICVVRELTKKFEEHYRFRAGNWRKISQDFRAKGEMVLLIHHKEKRGSSFLGEEFHELVESYLKKPRPKTLAKIFSLGGKFSVDEIYKKWHG